MAKKHLLIFASLYPVLLFSQSTADIIKGPYLQNVTKNSITIMWQTSASTFGTVYYGINSPYEFSKTDNNSVKIHEITLNNLLTETRYKYIVKSDQDSSKVYSFKTAVRDSSHFRFIAYGDTRPRLNNDWSYHNKVAAAMKNVSPDFVLHTGDLVYRGDSEDNWQDFFEGAVIYGSEAVLWPSIGNHDWYRDDNLENYRKYFSLPGNERFYSFNYGNAHFIAIDVHSSYLEGSYQFQWLADDLYNTSHDPSIRWIFAFMHYPYYNSGWDFAGRYSSLLTSIYPLFDSFNVDAVFTGHEHSYERTHLIRADKINPLGILYYVTGGGGAYMLTPAGDWFTANLASTNEFIHFIQVDIEGDEATFKTIPVTAGWGDVYETVKLINRRADINIYPPNSPQGLFAQGGDSTVILEWEANAESDVTGYNIYRSHIIDGTYEKLNDLPVTENQYSDTTVDNMKNYYYYITAVDNSDRESNMSNITYAFPHGKNVMILPPSEDAYVRIGSESGYGTRNYLYLGSDYQIFMKFQVEGIVSPPDKIILRLYCSDGSDNGGTVKFVENNSWGEGSLTGRNRPSMVGDPLGSFGPVYKNRWAKALLDTFIKRDGTYSIGIYSSSSDRAFYSSHETYYKTSPHLVLWWGKGGGFGTAPSMPILKSVTKLDSSRALVRWYKNEEPYLGGYKLYLSDNGSEWSEWEGNPVDSSDSLAIVEISPGKEKYFRLTAIDTSAFQLESPPGDEYGIRAGSNHERIIIVDGFDRYSGAGYGTGSWAYPRHPFAISYGKSIASCGAYFETAANEAVTDGSVNLLDYDVVIWFLGDESTFDSTFSPAEQDRVAEYLERGGKLFATGSEIAWDLEYRGSSADKFFLHEFLKVAYAGDDGGSYKINGIKGTIFEGLSFNIDDGTHGTYDEDWPDYYTPIGGSKANLKYGTAPRYAGVQYSGVFAGGVYEGKLVVLGFPFETVYPDSNREAIMKRVLDFFDITTEVQDRLTNKMPEKLRLFQNYPNPFNSKTKISLTVPEALTVLPAKLEIYDILGHRVKTLFHGTLKKGYSTMEWDGKNSYGKNVSSGIYIYTLYIGNYSESRRMLLLK